MFVIGAHREIIIVLAIRIGQPYNYDHLRELCNGL
jgi:hypothetical protein